MIGKVLVGLIAIFLLIGPFSSPITTGIHNWRSSTSTESYVVTTGGGVTAANITLGHDLYQAATGEITTISSNNSETPIASSYTEATKVLLVGALNASETRTLTVAYAAETDDTVMRALGPFLSFLIFGGLIGAILFGIWQVKGKR